MPLHSAKQRSNSLTVTKGLKSGRRDGAVVKDDADEELNRLKKHVELYKQENVMLRKNLNMPAIMEELKKSVAENNMEQMFFESLHELQFRLQQYESDSGASESLKVKDIQKDLDRQIALTESIRKEVQIKNSRIDDLENSLEECHSTIETLNNKITFISQTNKKLQQEKSSLETNITQLNEEITILKASNIALRTQISAMEKEITEADNKKLLSLTEEMSEIEQLRQDLRERDQAIDNQKQQIQQLETDIVCTKRRFQETEASMMELEKTTDRQNDRLGELNKDKEQLYIENEILKTDLETLRSKYDKQTQHVDDLKDELTKINDLNHSFINELSVLSETNADNKIIIQELQERCSKLSETNSSGDESLKEELATIKRENQKLKSKKEELEIACHEAFEKITQKDKKMKQQEDEYKKLIDRKDDTIQKLRQEKTMVDPTRSNATVAEVNALKDKLEKLSKELIETNAEIAMLKRV